MMDIEIAKRLEKLERDNRWFKRIGFAAVVIAAALAAMYTASCTATRRGSGTQGFRDKIRAREFDVLDASGKVRVKIAMHCVMRKDCWPVIDLYDQKGKELTNIGAGMLEISGEDGATTLLDDNIQITQKGLNAQADLGVGFMSPGAALTLFGREGMSVQLMSQSFLPGGQGGALNLMGKDGNSLFLDSDSPVIQIVQGKGPRMDLGSTALLATRTGATEQTSAASIVMFGNDKKHHVIWKVP